MPLLALLKEKRIKRKEALDGAGAILTKASNEKRKLTTEEEAEWTRRHAEGDELKTEIERLERQLDAEREISQALPDERRAGREDTGAREERGRELETRFSDMDKTRRDRIRKSSLRKWLGQTWGTGEDFTEEERSYMEYERSRVNPESARALSALSANGSAGAYTVPQDFAGRLDIAEKAYGDMLNMIDTTTLVTDSGALMPFPSMNDTDNTGEDLAESTAATETQDPSYGIVNFNAYMIDSGIIRIPLQLVQDAYWDPEEYLPGALGERLGRRKNLRFTNGAGSGSSQPQGIVGASTLGVTAASATAIAYSEILSLIHSVDPAYRPQSAFLFHDMTLLAIKKLTDSNGRPLFLAGGTAEGINGGDPDTINGYRFGINQDMDQIATTKKTILFGALKKYMVRTVRGNIMVRFAERYMNQFQVGIMVAQRIDGNLLNAGTNPVKYLQQS